MGEFSPLHALQNGVWFKLICGASFQHLPAIRTLATVYTLAGADCIDVAADPAVVSAARAGINAAHQVLRARGIESYPAVWLMVSLNDDEDPHFRKASFDPQYCPTACPQPCIAICPAEAIAFSTSFAGVIADRCYGCGRCLPICPPHLIEAHSHQASPTVVHPLVDEGEVQALELHTQIGHESAFQKLWEQVKPLLPSLKVLAISCPDGEGVLDYLATLYALMDPLPCPLIWQADGRPMSGDIGDGTTRATLNYGEALLRSPLPGFVQLAGGTNRHTVPKLQERNWLLQASETSASAPRSIAGVAYGSYARHLINPIQAQLEAYPQSSFRIEDYPDLLQAAIDLAKELVAPLKACGQHLSLRCESTV